MNTCRICGRIGDFPVIHIPEMVYGTRKKYTYFTCNQCGCLQIEEYPEDIDELYSNYSSFSSLRNERKLADWFYKKQCLYLKNKKGIIGKIVEMFFPHVVLHSVLDALDASPSKGFDTEICDFGCGSGGLLKGLFVLGYKNIVGFDPYVDETTLSNGVKLFRKNIYEINEKFDMVVLSHVLEHMPNQNEATKALINQMKTKKSKVIIHIPTISSENFEKYGEYSYILHPPFHYYLHSHTSIRYLLEQNGFEIEGIYGASNEQTMIFSEFFKKGVSLNELNLFKRLWSYTVGLLRYRKIAIQLNKKLRSDEICIVAHPK